MVVYIDHIQNFIKILMHSKEIFLLVGGCLFIIVYILRTHNILEINLNYKNVFYISKKVICTWIFLRSSIFCSTRKSKFVFYLSTLDEQSQYRQTNFSEIR